jgi:hypothetical protein
LVNIIKFFLNREHFEKRRFDMKSLRVESRKLVFIMAHSERQTGQTLLDPEGSAMNIIHTPVKNKSKNLRGLEKGKYTRPTTMRLEVKLSATDQNALRKVAIERGLIGAGDPLPRHIGARLTEEVVSEASKGISIAKLASALQA